MSSWMQERDRLMAQTLAFVQGVTGARPEVTDRPVDATLPAHPVAEALPNDIVVQQPPAPPNGNDTPNDLRLPPDHTTGGDDIAASASAVLSASSAPPRPHHPKPVAPSNETAAAPPISTAQRQIPLTAGSEREDILNRVAAFRAQQSRLSRDRETYYEEMRVKIQRRLGADDSDKVLP